MPAETSSAGSIHIGVREVSLGGVATSLSLAEATSTGGIPIGVREVSVGDVTTMTTSEYYLHDAFSWLTDLFICTLINISEGTSLVLSAVILATVYVFLLSTF